MKQSIVVIILFFSINIAFSQDRYWVGGSGSWEDTNHWSITSGGVAGVSIPSPNDNVHFDTNSFAGTGNFSIVSDTIGRCHDFKYTNTAAIVSISFQAAPSSERRLDISGSATFQSSLSINSNLYFISPDTGETIQSNGYVINSTSYLTGSGDYSLLDSLSAPNNVILIYSALYTQNYPLTVNSMTVYSGGELHIGSSTINVGMNLSINNGSTFSESGAQVLLTANLSTLTGYAVHFQYVHFSHDGTLGGSLMDIDTVIVVGELNHQNTNGSFGYVDVGESINFLANGTIDSLFLNAGYYIKFGENRTLTITDTIEISGDCLNGWTDLYSFSSYPNTIPSATINSDKDIGLDYVRIQNMKATGLGAPITAINSSDLGGNTGWNITNSPRSLYWVGGPGNWSDLSHWSLSSGGVGGVCIPGPTDDVIFDDASFIGSTDQVTINEAAYCHDMTWLNTTGTPKLYQGNYNDLYVYGSLLWSANMAAYAANQADLFFMSADLNETITCNNVSYNNAMAINGGGSFIMQDSIYCQNLEINDGTLNTNNQSLKTGNLIINDQLNGGESLMDLDYCTINSTATIDMDSCDLYIQLSFSNYLQNEKFDRLYFDGTTPADLFSTACDFNYVEFLPSGDIRKIGASVASNHFGRLVFQDNGFFFSGGNYIDTLEFSPGKTYTFNTYSSPPDTVNVWNARSNCALGNTIIKGTANTSKGKIYATANQTLAQVTLTNLEGQGPASFNALASIDGGGNINWNFITPTTLYWVGDSGDWMDENHWAYVSGGEGGACLPTSIDHVIFDQNSFSGPNEGVNISDNAVCNNMTWTMVDGPVLTGDMAKMLSIYGSLSLHNSMFITFTGDINFESQVLGQSILSNGVQLQSDISFNGVGGGWTISDDFYSSQQIEFLSGILDLGSDEVHFEKLVSNSTNLRTLDLGSAYVKVSGSGDVWQLDSTNLSFTAGASAIHFYGTNVVFKPNSNYSYNDVVFNNGVPSENAEISDANNVHFQYVEFRSNAIINGSHSFDAVVFAYYDYIFEANSTQEFDDFIIDRPILDTTFFHSSLDGSEFYLESSAANVCLDLVKLKDCHALSAQIYSVINAQDISNNIGWNFNSIFYKDNDGDNFGDSNQDSMACFTPTGFVIDSTDCDDSRSYVFPGAPELCDGLDNDCDNLTDEDHPPIAICKDITVSLDNTGQVVIGANQIDNGSTSCSGVNLSLNFNTFSCVDTGMNIVMLTVTDDFSNIGQCMATIAIIDDENPTVIAQDVTINLTTSGSASITPSMINNGSSDNCGIDTIYLDKYDFDCNDIGANTVILTVIDENGNIDSATASVTVDDVLLVDYYALEAFYNGAKGYQWSNTIGNNEPWLVDCDPCGIEDGTPWYGVTCDGTGRVTELNLISNNLDSIIAPDITDLTELTKLFLLNNSLSGTIPNTIDNLGKLEFLYLSSNNLSGNLPESLGDCPIKWLVLHHNTNLTGCYESHLINLCSSLHPSANSNSNISDNTGLNDWEDFCNCGANVCPCNDTNVWIGGSGLWSEKNNWSLGHVPTACEDVEITSNGIVVTVPLNYTSTIYSLLTGENTEIDLQNGAMIDIVESIRTSCN